uniref:mammalian ependymin-related protein 1-like n=1 Tax=Styela clava TaxID=7725 RepID=UPI00193A0FB9|nr:mammalian ependymin-related protein 1-like [Styela clava]
MYYDAIGERIRFIEETMENDTRSAEDILVLYRERKEYKVDLKTRKCTKSEPKMEFRPIGVEKGYKHVSDITIGAPPGDGVGLGVWVMTENSTTVQGTFVSEFTHRDCIPFYHEFRGMMHGQTLHFHRTYFDVTLREFGHEEFAIPKECMADFDTTLL